MIRFPLVTRPASPPTTKDIPSVAISELMRKNVAITPLTSPTARPTAMPTKIARTGLTDSASFVATTLARA